MKRTIYNLDGTVNAATDTRTLADAKAAKLLEINDEFEIRSEAIKHHELRHFGVTELVALKAARDVLETQINAALTLAAVDAIVWA